MSAGLATTFAVATVAGVAGLVLGAALAPCPPDPKPGDGPDGPNPDGDGGGVALAEVYQFGQRDPLAEVVVDDPDGPYDQGDDQGDDDGPVGAPAGTDRSHTGGCPCGCVGLAIQATHWRHVAHRLTAQLNHTDFDGAA